MQGIFRSTDFKRSSHLILWHRLLGPLVIWINIQVVLFQNYQTVSSKLFLEERKLCFQYYIGTYFIKLTRFILVFTFSRKNYGI